ncbi:MAG: restriction endonuclease subunit S [Firmicutes bacterium]|nr:restriction endonuclease subunit S [Bacillota bacterium]
MSRLQQLIQELCPDGVKYVKLEDVCVFERGTSITKKDIIEGDIPVVAGGQEPAYYCNQANRTGETVVISSSGAYAGYVSYWNQPIFVSDAFTVKPNDFLLTKYLYYFLVSKQARIYSLQKGGGVPHVYSSDVALLKIPIPPISVQQEIVRILDTFTGLNKELNAELTARKKQYQHYMDLLLTFNDERQERLNVKWVRLGEIGKVSMCKRIMKAQTSPEGDVPFYKIGTFGGMPDAYISKELYEEYKSKYPFPKEGDGLISASGSIGRTVIYKGEPAYYQDSNIVWIDNDEKIVLNKYLYYYYQLQPWYIPTGGTIKRLYNYILEQTEIPVPPLEEQQRIVNILDRFDTLINDPTIGLPAEIEARKKQYEYYLNKILDFKEVTS